jgi:sirohydrochlorin ferrochelatase
MVAAAARAQAQPAAFILTTDLQPHQPAWPKAEAQAREVALACGPILGFEPDVRLVHTESVSGPIVPDGITELFVCPLALDLNLFQRETLGRLLAEARRSRPNVVVHHDDVDPGHSLVVDCFADQVAKTIGTGAPQRSGLILAPSGHGDSASRAQSYRLMRLIWERLGLAIGEVGFVRHAQPFLLSTLEECARRPVRWILLPQTQWTTEHVEFAETILQNFQRSHPEAAEWRMAEPPGNHPAITAWLVHRIKRLWIEKRAREAARVTSPKHSSLKPRSWQLGKGTIASIPDRRSMAALLERILPAKTPGRILVKVTWHGYATGTYTDPAALGLLLGALPAPAIVLEGHTSSRSLEDAGFDWETEAKKNRAWIRQQEAEYLRRTGLADVLARHRAEYVNVTEAFWDGVCTRDTTFAIPEVLLQYRGCPMISFAKFKGPTRLGISNLFGLIPEPLRDAWHGPNITYIARVCCDLAKLYGALFPLCGLNEGLYTAVRWNRQGLYRSRWGNYDLISNAGHVTSASNLVSADILASRLQGQDVRRSAFFDVVRAELGWDEAAATEPLPLVLT